MGRVTSSLWTRVTKRGCAGVSIAGGCCSVSWPKLPGLFIGSASARPLDGLVVQDSLPARNASNVPDRKNSFASVSKRPRLVLDIGETVVAGRRVSCAMAHNFFAVHLDMSMDCSCLLTATAVERALAALFSIHEVDSCDRELLADSGNAMTNTWREEHANNGPGSGIRMDQRPPTPE